MKKLIILSIFILINVRVLSQHILKSDFYYGLTVVEQKDEESFEIMVQGMSVENKEVLSELRHSGILIQLNGLKMLENPKYCTGPDSDVFKEQLFRMSLSGTPMVRAQALRFLGKHFLFSDQTSWSLVQALKHSTMPPPTTKDIKSTQPLVKTFNVELRLMALHILEKQIVDTSNTIFYPWWFNLLSHPKGFVRQAVISSFQQKTGTLPDYVVSTIEDMAIHDPSNSVRLVAVGFLEKAIVNTKLDDQKLVTILKKKNNFDVQKKMLTILNKFYPRSIEVQRVISDNMWHSSKTLSQLALSALEKNPYLHGYIREEIKRKKSGQLVPTEFLSCKSAWDRIR